MVHFVCKADGWVLEKTAHLLAEHIGASVSEEPRWDVSANIYFPYYLFKKSGTLDIALFTHREISTEPAAIQKAAIFDEVANLADWCVAMSNKTASLLPYNKTSVIELPVNPALAKGVLKVGICGIEQPFNRKRWNWLREMRIPGVEFHVTNGGLTEGEMPGWYDSVDYILVLGGTEGGPMPVKEAMAHCKPVIAPDVGWAWEYPVLRYESQEDLRSIITRLVPKDGLPEAASKITSLVSFLESQRDLSRRCA